jgi:carbon monoxide dehydrogenase subunit G
MEFDNAFEVPLPVADAWKVLMDIRRIAPCMPGAELTDVIDDRTYKGKIGVRLGPVALTFAGTVKFEEIDDANHTARVVAQGTDAKGRGAANAVAAFRLEPAAGGTAEMGTKVLVHTNLTLSGAVAQYGRGVGIIQMTAAQIITQFANNLKAQLARDGAASATAVEATMPTVSASSPSKAAAGSEPGETARPGEPVAASPAAAVQPVAVPEGIAAKPISGFALIAGVLWTSLKRLFGRG